jgi:phage baseplate assembly protein W
VSNIVLRNLEKPTRLKEVVSEGYLYKDVLFDLNPAYTRSGEFQKSPDQVDLEPQFDKSAVITSLVNIFTTSPGEKLLNPTFGIDLRHFLFDPVTETRAFLIGNKIYDQLTVQEPRVDIEQIEVTAFRDDQRYVVDLLLSIPTLNLYGVSLVGVLNNDGFIVDNVS